MYRNNTVREMRRSWENERLIYLRKIDELLDKLMLATGKPVMEPQMTAAGPVGYDRELQDAIDDFVPALETYS